MLFYRGKKMVIRKDLARVAENVSSETGFGFAETYIFLFEVLKETGKSIKWIRENVRTSRKKIFISERIQMFNMETSRGNYHNVHYLGATAYSAAADYWENRILARQEMYD